MEKSSMTVRAEDVMSTPPSIKTEALLVTQQAKRATETEHNLTVRQALQQYRKAILWCLVVSGCVIMEGYDTILISNFFAYPAFARKYGFYNKATDNYQLSAPWQAALSNAPSIGAFFGAFLNGYLVKRFGHIRVLIASLITLSALVFIVFFAPDVTVLLIGEVLCGFPWGIFATTAPAYASEVLPISLRVYLTSWTNMCFIIGQLIAAGVLAGLVQNDTEWSYRVPFALQWFWPMILIPALCFAPDTPWHLVRCERLEDAEKSLAKLRPRDSAEQLKQDLALIIHTNKLEKELLIGTSYLDCFKGFELRRTEIACMVFLGTVLSGLSYAYNSTYFFQQIGLTTNQTYFLNLGGTFLALVGTLVSWFAIMPYAGRRAIYLWGMGAMCGILYLIGILNVRTANNKVAMAQAALTLLWTFVFQLSAGQIGWAMPAEVGSTRLRQKTVCLGRNAYSLVNIVSNVLQPYFMNPTEWNLKGYTGFFWGSTALLTFVWAFFRLPETKGRTFEELDILFARHVPARKFKKCNIDGLRDEDSA